MCGIAGIIHSDRNLSVDPQILKVMNGSLRHRGPDDEGYWLRKNVGLAMRRLSIIDVEGGHQPVSNETKEIWTVFNGEIYNFQELRAELILKGHRFESRTDTEVIVHLYEEEGELFVNKLRGMFAIALWDERSEKLLLYRDRVGIKPLHYCLKNGSLIFGSEIKALLEYPGISRDLSSQALSDYLSFLYVPQTQTIYREVKRLLPGHYLKFQGRSLDIYPYWKLSHTPDPKISEGEWIERLRAELNESVKLHMISDVPLGAFLSGGMDSSTVVANMSRHASSIKTFSIGFHADGFDELPYARQVSSVFSTEHHEDYVEADALKLLPKLLRFLDEPFADSSALPTSLVSEFARRQVTVALSGDGGDELFGGYLWTQKELWLEKYRKLSGPMKFWLRSLLINEKELPARESGFWNSLKRFVYDGSLDPADSFARRLMCFQPWMKRELLQPWVREQVEENSNRLVRQFFEASGSSSPLDKCLYFDSMVYLPDDLLTKVDRMSMMHSLEVRVPLLDHKVVELAAKIPFSLKMKKGQTKYILRKAMEGILPPSILAQRKHGFAVPLEHWFKGSLLGFAKEQLLNDKSFSSKYFVKSYIEKVFKEHESGKQRYGNQIYTLLVFELWGQLSNERAEKVPAGTPGLEGWLK